MAEDPYNEELRPREFDWEEEDSTAYIGPETGRVYDFYHGEAFQFQEANCYINKLNEEF